MIVKDVRDKLPGKGEYPRRGNELTTIDIHHSASQNYKGFPTIAGFANYHITEHNWPGLGYHYVVGPEGVVWKTGYMDEIRWSVGLNNSYSISIMMIGSFGEDDPTEEQYDTTVELAAQLINAYGSDIIKGHNEFEGHAANICPGINMDKFREDVDKKIFK